MQFDTRAARRPAMRLALVVLVLSVQAASAAAQTAEPQIPVGSAHSAGSIEAVTRSPDAVEPAQSHESTLRPDSGQSAYSRLGGSPADSVVTGVVLVPITDELVLPRVMTVDLRALTGALLGEVNEARRAAGAPALRVDPALTEAAARYSRELADRGEIAHVSETPGRRTFRDRIAAAGATAALAGENLARMTSAPPSLAQDVVRGWQGSPGHRRNLLDRQFTRTGIGIALGRDGIWYVAQLYATSD